MKIHVWRAFDSNNSGSYVIVGSFPSESSAAELAREFDEVCRAQSAWLAANAEGESPLTAYARRCGIEVDPLVGQSDEWPEYSPSPHPLVWSVGHQVFVYSDYCVTMPTLFGHAIYRRGGRVTTELDHAHHRIVAVHDLRVPWSQREGVAERVRALLDALLAADGPLATYAKGEHAAAWRTCSGFDEPHVRLGVIFERAQLAAGSMAVCAVARAHGFTTEIRLHEAWDASSDPLAFLRTPGPR